MLIRRTERTARRSALAQRLQRRTGFTLTVSEQHLYLSLHIYPPLMTCPAQIDAAVQPPLARRGAFFL